MLYLCTRVLIRVEHLLMKKKVFMMFALLGAMAQGV
jgi:hypothetical protein